LSLFQKKHLEKKIDFFSPLSTQNLTRFAIVCQKKKIRQIFGIENLQKKKTHIHTIWKEHRLLFFLKNVLAVSEKKILGKKLEIFWLYFK